MMILHQLKGMNSFGRFRLSKAAIFCGRLLPKQPCEVRQQAGCQRRWVHRLVLDCEDFLKWVDKNGVKSTHMIRSSAISMTLGSGSGDNVIELAKKNPSMWLEFTYIVT